MKGRMFDIRKSYSKMFEIALITSLMLHIVLLQSSKIMQFQPVKKEVVLSALEFVDIPRTESKKSHPAPALPFVPLFGENEMLLSDIDDIWVLQEDYISGESIHVSEPENIVPIHKCDLHPVPEGGYAAILEHLVYPEIARRAGIEGTVVVKVLIDERGQIVNLGIVKSMGASGCDEAALKAVEAVKWYPALQQDMPVKVWLTIPIRFELTF